MLREGGARTLRRCVGGLVMRTSVKRREKPLRARISLRRKPSRVRLERRHALIEKANELRLLSFFRTLSPD